MTLSMDRGGIYLHESGIPGSPAILFIHGAGQSGQEWRNHMARLPTFHCLAPDLPGHGRSNHLRLPSQGRLVDDLAGIIETRVPAGRAHVVGISWGANLALELMQRHPDRVDRVVSDGTLIALPRLGKPLMIGIYGLLTPFLHTRPVLAWYRDIVDAADLRLVSRLAYWRAVMQCRDGCSTAVDAPCPTLLVAGEKERFMRVPDAALAALMPRAEARYAPGLDHCWQRKAPDLHIRMVEAWCTGRELPSELRREPAPTPEAVERMRRKVAATA